MLSSTFLAASLSFIERSSSTTALTFSRGAFHMRDRYSCQIHFNDCFFHAASTAMVQLNDGYFKGGSFKFGYFLGDLPRSSSEFAAVVPVAVALALLLARILHGARDLQFMSFLFLRNLLYFSWL